MSNEEKVGQLLMVGFAGSTAGDEITHWVRDRRVGGVALFSRNIIDLAQTARLTAALQRKTDGGVPLFLALDQEGGNVVRIRQGVVLLPSSMALGATRDPALAYAAGLGLGIDLRLLGFNMNLAPVLDVNSNPDNPVIGTRSYGERAELVGAMGAWFIRGQQQEGVVSVAKHFPGHGDTQTDSHFSMPTIDADLSRLERVELQPFRQAIGAGLDAVMTAHIALPRLAEAPMMPATLSYNILSGLLRQHLGFDGLVMTDGLEMQGIVQRYGTGRASVMAILAGADMPMILWNTDAKEEVYQALLQAVRSGEITEARLDQSVRRILQVKHRRGLLGYRRPPSQLVWRDPHRQALHADLSERIAQKSVTLVRNARNLLPLHPDHQSIVILAPPGPFGERFKREPGVTVVTMPLVPSSLTRRRLVERLVRLLHQGDILVAAVVNRYHVEVVRNSAARAPEVPVALVSFASPYYLKFMPSAQAYVCTYSYLDSAQRAVADGLLGVRPMPGRLPVTIPGLVPYGSAGEEKLARGDLAGQGP